MCSTSFRWLDIRLRLHMTKLLVSNALQTSLWVNPSGLFSNCCLDMWSSKVMRRLEKNWLTADRVVDDTATINCRRSVWTLAMVVVHCWIWVLLMTWRFFRYVGLRTCWYIGTWIGPWPGTEVQRISFKLKSNANRHGLIPAQGIPLQIIHGHFAHE